MKCERSRKKDVLKQWGIRQLGNGCSWDEVTSQMTRMMRKTLPEVLDFARQSLTSKDGNGKMQPR